MDSVQANILDKSEEEVTKVVDALLILVELGGKMMEERASLKTKVHLLL